jgi:hypothetical protein
MELLLCETHYVSSKLFCEGRSRSSGHLVAEDCCAKRTMSPRSPLIDTFLGTPFGSSGCHFATVVMYNICIESSIYLLIIISLNPRARTCSLLLQSKTTCSYLLIIITVYTTCSYLLIIITVYTHVNVPAHYYYSLKPRARTCSLLLQSKPTCSYLLILQSIPTCPYLLIIITVYTHVNVPARYYYILKPRARTCLLLL